MNARTFFLALLLVTLVGLISASAYMSIRGEVRSNCGNKTLDKGEVCDDGNMNNFDGCTTGCAILTGWTCTGSTALCKQTCGNGTVNGPSGESCDDGNFADGDGCSRICRLEKTFSCSGEPSKCKCIKSAKECGLLQCGDGVTQRGEQCDDGNTTNEDGCTASCALEEGYNCKGTICSRDINMVVEEQKKKYRTGVQ